MFAFHIRPYMSEHVSVQGGGVGELPYEKIGDARRLGINKGFWSRLGRSRQNATIPSSQSIFQDALQHNKHLRHHCSWWLCFVSSSAKHLKNFFINNSVNISFFKFGCLMPDLEISITNSSIVHVFQSQDYFWCIEPYLEIQIRTEEILLRPKKSHIPKQAIGATKNPLQKKKILNPVSKTNLPFQAKNFN